MRLVGAGLLCTVLAAGLTALGWTCVQEAVTVAACAAVIVHDDRTFSSDLVARCVARAWPTVVVGSVRDPGELIVAVRAGATSVVDRDLPVPELLDAVQRGLTTATATQADELTEALRARAVLRHRLNRLTPREATVLTELAAGRVAAAIAERHEVSVATVRAHIRSILVKLDVASQLAAVAEGRRGWRELNLADHMPCPAKAVPAVVAPRFPLLSDADWSRIRDLFPARVRRRGRPFADARSTVEGIIYRYRCGIAWREVPAVFGPWQTIWTWHRRMCADRTWDMVLSRLPGAVDGVLAVDTALARAHRQALRVTRESPGWVKLRLSDTS